MPFNKLYRPKPYMHLSCLPYVPHVLPISFLKNLTTEYIPVSSVGHNAPHYVVFCNPPPPLPRSTSSQKFTSAHSCQHSPSKFHSKHQRPVLFTYKPTATITVLFVFIFIFIFETQTVKQNILHLMITNFNLSIYKSKFYTDSQVSYCRNNIKIHTSISGVIFSAYRICNFTFRPLTLFKTRSRVKRGSSLESLSMTLKLLRTREVVDLSSSIANF
jgi:hypothetical protein